MRNSSSGVNQADSALRYHEKNHSVSLMGNLLCLSHIISQNSPSYGKRDNFHIKKNSIIKNNQGSNTSKWFFSNNHFGTHIDSPYHFCETGKKTFEFPIIEFLFRQVELVDIPCNDAKLIGESDLMNFTQINPDVELLLIRTGYELLRYEESYWNNNPGISSDLAGYFRKYYPKLRCLGFDFISLTSWKHRVEGHKSHTAFLCPDIGEPILVIEDMSLKSINVQLEWVIVSPMFVEDGNGGPVTVFAMEE